MRTCRLRLAALPIVLAALMLASRALGRRDAGLAALQVALQSRGVYAGSIDGVKRPGHDERRSSASSAAPACPPDGIPGSATRKALGRYGKHVLGSRPLTRGATGWDVAALQFLLAWHGFPSATIDGGLGVHTELALRHFQRWAGLEPDGVAGATTYAALRRAPELPDHARLAGGRAGRRRVRPARQPLPRRDRHRRAAGHAGRGRGRRSRRLRRLAAGGWGNLVVVAHADGVRTMYAHLSSITVRLGSASRSATVSGRSAQPATPTGPHLHFEVRLRGAAVDPRPALS